MNAIFSSRGFGAKVDGSRKLRVETAVEEKNECVAIVSADRRVIGEGVRRAVRRPEGMMEFSGREGYEGGRVRTEQISVPSSSIRQTSAPF